MLDSRLAAFEQQLGRALRDHPEREPPLPGYVELALTGAHPARLMVDARTGQIAPRRQAGSPLTIRVPRAEFDVLVERGLQAWLVAYDRGVVEIQGDPMKVEALKVYVDRVLRRMD